jgi:hypothetical protein
MIPGRRTSGPQTLLSLVFATITTSARSLQNGDMSVPLSRLHAGPPSDEMGHILSGQRDWPCRFGRLPMYTQSRFLRYYRLGPGGHHPWPVITGHPAPRPHGTAAAPPAPPCACRPLAPPPAKIAPIAAANPGWRNQCELYVGRAEPADQLVLALRPRLEQRRPALLCSARSPRSTPPRSGGTRPPRRTPSSARTAPARSRSTAPPRSSARPAGPAPTALAPASAPRPHRRTPAAGSRCRGD